MDMNPKAVLLWALSFLGGYLWLGDLFGTTDIRSGLQCLFVGLMISFIAEFLKK